MPALLTRMSMRPPSTRVASSASSSRGGAESRRGRRRRSRRARRRARISSTTSAPRSALRPATTTCAPSAANASAIARPMLLVAPVTSAVFPCESTSHGGPFRWCDRRSAWRWTAQSRNRITKWTRRSKRYRAVDDPAHRQGRRHPCPHRRGGRRPRARARRRRHEPRRHPRRDRDEQEPALPLLPRRQERAGRRHRALQSERVLDAQRPFLDTLDTWEAWEGWRDAVVAHYGSQPHWGCPIGALVERADRQRPRARRRGRGAHGPLAGLPGGGLERMRDAGLLRPDADPARSRSPSSPRCTAACC